AVAFAESTDLFEHDIKVHGPIEPLLTQGTIQVIVDLKGGDRIDGFDRNFLSQTVVKDLERSGIQAAIFQGNYRAAFNAKTLSLEEILSPKVWLDVSVRKSPSDYGHTIQSNVSYIRYEASSSKQLYRPTMWNRPQLATSVAERDVPKLLSQFIDREIKELSKIAISRKTIARSKLPPTARGGYSYRWNDPNANKPALHIGATMGTPALGNLHLGLTNLARVPISISVSGMYWTIEKRGIQAELSYLIAQEGRLKHAAGLALVGVNETTVTDIPINPNGRSLGTDIFTENAIKFYLGPVYTLDWRDLRFELGAGTRVSSGAASAVRVFFQIGYTPRFSF
ncbi:MAG: hypothetical protein HY537_02855, partial [Deltaproteobacteria bacterium]|nr:hypothetical protein [Deltaproteobacteria bacterium]